MTAASTSLVKAQVDTGLKLQAEATMAAIADSYAGRVEKTASVDELFDSLDDQVPTQSCSEARRR